MGAGKVEQDLVSASEGASASGGCGGGRVRCTGDARAVAEIREGVPEAGAAAGLVGETLQMCFRERVRAKSFEGTGPS